MYGNNFVLCNNLESLHPLLITKGEWENVFFKHLKNTFLLFLLRQHNFSTVVISNNSFHRLLFLPDQENILIKILENSIFCSKTSLAYNFRISELK